MHVLVGVLQVTLAMRFQTRGSVQNVCPVREDGEVKDAHGDEPGSRECQLAEAVVKIPRFSHEKRSVCACYGGSTEKLRREVGQKGCPLTLSNNIASQVVPFKQDDA